MKARIEIDGQSAEFEGSSEEVVSAVIRYVSQAYPALSIAKKISFSPDLAELVEQLSPVLAIADNGTVMVKKEVSAEDGVLLVTAGSDLAAKLGKRGDPSAGVEEIVLTLNMAEKTVRNVCSLLSKQGQIIRDGKGRYRISPTGIFHLLSRLGTGGKK